MRVFRECFGVVENVQQNPNNGDGEYQKINCDFPIKEFDPFELFVRFLFLVIEIEDFVVQIYPLRYSTFNSLWEKYHLFVSSCKSELIWMVCEYRIWFSHVLTKVKKHSVLLDLPSIIWCFVETVTQKNKNCKIVNNLVTYVQIYKSFKISLKLFLKVFFSRYFTSKPHGSISHDE